MYVCGYLGAYMLNYQFMVDIPELGAPSSSPQTKFLGTPLLVPRSNHHLMPCCVAPHKRQPEQRELRAYHDDDDDDDDGN